MNNDIYNSLQKYFLDILLYLISKNESFAKDFQALLPDDIKSKVDSFRQNNSCSCKNNLTNFAIQNKEIVFTFMKNFIESHKEMSLDFIKEDIEKKYKNLDVSGSIYRIPKNDIAFENFVNFTKEQRFLFKSMSVTAENDQWVIFFI